MARLGVSWRVCVFLRVWTGRARYVSVSCRIFVLSFMPTRASRGIWTSSFGRHLCVNCQIYVAVPKDLPILKRIPISTNSCRTVDSGPPPLPHRILTKGLLSDVLVGEVSNFQSANIIIFLVWEEILSAPQIMGTLNLSAAYILYVCS